jgi:hypothetical protein
MGLTSRWLMLGDARRPDLAPIAAGALVGTGAARRAVTRRLACRERPGLGGAKMPSGHGSRGVVPAGGSSAALHQGLMAGGTNPANPNIPALLAEACR